MTKIRYVSLYPVTGEFTNSWDEETHNKILPDIDFETTKAIKPNVKVIKYECLNDDNFEFMNQMKLR